MSLHQKLDSQLTKELRLSSESAFHLPKNAKSIMDILDRMEGSLKDVKWPAKITRQLEELADLRLENNTKEKLFQDKLNKVSEQSKDILDGDLKSIVQNPKTNPGKHPSSFDNPVRKNHVPSSQLRNPLRSKPGKDDHVNDPQPNRTQHQIS